MNRKVALATVGTGTAAASAATAAYALNNSGNNDDVWKEDGSDTATGKTTTVPISTTNTNSGKTSGAQSKDTENTNSNLSNGLSTNSASDKKSTYFGDKMAFANANFNPSSTGTTLNKETNDFFGNFDSNYVKGDYNKIKSNLKITVTRHTCSDNKKWGGGEMTGFWSFENQKTNKGFITFNKATANKDKKGLVMTGIFYLMEKDNNQGKVKSQKEIKNSDNKVITKSNFKQYFPKPYGYTQAGKFDKLYYTNGDFIKDANQLDSMCDSETGTSSTTKFGEWEYKSSQGWETHGGGGGFEGYNHVYDWAGDHSDASGVQGFEFMYGKDTFQLEDQLSSFYIGTWEVKKPWGNMQVNN